MSTKSPIRLSLTNDQREYISDLIATRYLDGMDNRDLERFFFDAQVEYLKEYTDNELLGVLEEVTNEDEFDAAVNHAN
jgi:exonuclease V gamma subunit